ncbi:vitellogenin-like, partial [Frankliniella occidentalis]|uniref:Vitellogenin-like n=1 Tax=Frankliniella occidentalis TaxID=133901 RepID=A0A9C6XW84_FRAOC
MMWKPFLLFCLVAAAAASSEHGWKAGSEYKYQVRGRTLTALHQVANQYAGVLMKAQLTVQPKSDNVLIAKVNNAEYAKINEQLPAGWGTPIPSSKLSYHQLPVSSKPFEIKLKNGIVDELIVSKNIPTWEVNMLKGIASQLQVDTQAENLISSRINNKPSHGSVNGVYKTMEDSVTGECEVVYDISPLPQYQLQSRPELAPMPQLRGDGQLIDIVKTKNFSHCEQRPGYHY